MTVIAASAWYRVSRDGEVTTVSFGWWTRLLALLIGIAVAAYGFRLYQKRSHYYRYGPVLMVLGPVLIILTIPMLLLNKTVVDDQRFEFADGMWWNIHRYEVRFDDVRNARLETQEKQTRNSTYLERRLVLEMKDGVAQPLSYGTPSWRPGLILFGIFSHAGSRISRRLFPNERAATLAPLSSDD
jgi:hypothetical protein